MNGKPIIGHGGGIQGHQPTVGSGTPTTPPNVASGVRPPKDPMGRIADALERLAAHLESKKEPLRKG
jgi:hypothetical protein